MTTCSHQAFYKQSKKVLYAVVIRHQLEQFTIFSDLLSNKKPKKLKCCYSTIQSRIEVVVATVKVKVIYCLY